MRETYRGKGLSVIHSFEPIQVVIKIDPLKEFQKRSPANGVHPLTFEMIKDTLIPGRKHPISEIQLRLIIKYYTSDFSFGNILSTREKMNEMALLENCIDNLRRSLPEDQQEQFPVELTPVFKRGDLGLLTDKEEKIYLQAFTTKTECSDSDSANIRKVLSKGRESRARRRKSLNSPKFNKKKS